MTNASLAPAIKQPRRRFGKDHLNLADWRISVPTFQQPRKKNGGKVDFAEYVIDRPDGRCQRVTIEASSKTGLPTASDEDVVIALLYYAKEQGFASDVVRFIPTQLLRVMQWPVKADSYRRLKLALKRLRSVTVTYESTWYSRKKNKTEPILITGIIAEAELTIRRGVRAKNSEPDSYVQWTKNFYESLKEGNLTNLDLDLYFSCKRPGTRHLYRHLNKVWHNGKKPKAYERDLKELACSHLGMTDSKDLKRNFDALIQELEHREYLVPVDRSVRYRKVRPGVWRVRLDLNPEQCTKKEPPKNASRASSEAHDLVRSYYSHRFGETDRTPTTREIGHAQALLAQYDVTLLNRIVPKVASTVQECFGDDLYFGAAVRTFETLAQAQQRRSRSLERERQQHECRQDELAQISEKKRERNRKKDTLLARWNALSEEERTACHEAALRNATSDVQRRRITRSLQTGEPALEVLQAIAREERDRGGDLKPQQMQEVPDQLALWM